MKIQLDIHSFVDLITNSSSEVFVMATEQTVKTVKEIVDHTLKHSGSRKTFDDYYTIKRYIPAGTYIYGVENLEDKDVIDLINDIYDENNGLTHNFYLNDSKLSKTIVSLIEGEIPYACKIKIEMESKTDDEHTRAVAKLFSDLLGTIDAVGGAY